MKVSALEARGTKKLTITIFKRVILLILIFVLLTIILIYFCRSKPKPLRPSQVSFISSIPTHQRNNLSSLLQSPITTTNNASSIALKQSCNISKGNWIPHIEGPYYTNSTKCVIDDRQNCMKFGRPDTDFVKWRWKPDGCELSLFDASQFLDLVRGKSMAFIGDSVGRNQIESLMCLLASVASPVHIPHRREAIRCWLYKDYNFMLAHIWSPNLVKFSLGNPNISSVLGVLNLYLDEVDEVWTTQTKNFDYMIISAGHWFSRPLIYHEKGKIIGCHDCKNMNITDLTRYYGYRMALRTTFRTILSLPDFKGVTYFRSISPTHFGSEDWVKEGNCSSTRPSSKQEMKLEANILEFYLTQLDEFRAAEREGKKRGFRFKLMDITEAMGMRPDGHPYQYGHPQNKNESIADCLHWCLPGPIDLWNEVLLHMLKMDDKE